MWVQSVGPNPALNESSQALPSVCRSGPQKQVAFHDIWVCNTLQHGQPSLGSGKQSQAAAKFPLGLRLRATSLAASTGRVLSTCKLSFLNIMVCFIMVWVCVWFV